MTDRTSEGFRKASVDLAREPTKKLIRLSQSVISAMPTPRKTLQNWLPRSNQHILTTLNMPPNINWKDLETANNTTPGNYEELLRIQGIGPATVRGLALIAELVYGEKPSWKDPVKYSFAYGGKDGVPYPVNRESMDESIEILKQAVQSAKLGDREKTHALKGLRKFVPRDAENS